MEVYIIGYLINRKIWNKVIITARDYIIYRKRPNPAVGTRKPFQLLDSDNFNCNFVIWKNFNIILDTHSKSNFEKIVHVKKFTKDNYIFA